MGSFVKSGLLAPVSTNDENLIRQPTSGKSWLEKFQCASKFTKTTAGWPDSVKQWTIHVGSKLSVWTLLADSISFPLSRLPAVLHTKEERGRYREMLVNMGEMYTAVMGNGTSIEREFQLGQYAVAWVDVRKQFYRVRVKELYAPRIFIVHTLDSCQKILVSMDDLYPICEEFLQLRPLVTVLHLDGLERFDCCWKMLNLMRKIEWKVTEALEFEVTKVVKDQIYGTLRFYGDRGSINLTLLIKFWKSCSAPRLPAIGSNCMQVSVVHAEENGTVYLRLRSPISLALQDYCRKAETKLQSRFDQAQELMTSRPKGTIDANSVYLVAWGHPPVFLRVKSDGQSDEDNKKKTVRLRAIDTGRKITASRDELVLASEVYSLLPLVPPQCIEAKLSGVLHLNVQKFNAEYCNGASPVKMILRTTAKATVDRPGEVLLFRDCNERLVNLSEEVIERGFGFLAAPGPTKLPALRYASTQLGHINMKKGTRWSIRPEGGMIPGDQITFTICKIINDSEFVIQPFLGSDTVRGISEKISEYINLPHMERVLSRQRNHRRHVGWFYAYKSVERNLLVRVMVTKTLKCDKALILLIDFGEFAVTECCELMLGIPYSLRSIGPQAARVHKSDISKLKTDPSAENPVDSKNNIFRAYVDDVTYDKCGLAAVQLTSVEAFHSIGLAELTRQVSGEQPPI